jgi:hypothetical protein
VGVLSAQMADPNTPHSTAVATQSMYYQGLSVMQLLTQTIPTLKQGLPSTAEE